MIRYADVVASKLLSEQIPMHDADVLLYHGVFSAMQQEHLLRSLLHNVPWEQHVIKMYGRSIAAPRLSAWYGDPGAHYSYSGLRLEPLSWTPTLLEIKSVVEALADIVFNSALLNLYRDGRDSVGWHSDAEPELGRNPVIASVSLGAERRFMFQHRKFKTRLALDLEPGSILLMRGPTQHHWRHQLPKTRKPVGMRVNLTFRIIR